MKFKFKEIDWGFVGLLTVAVVCFVIIGLTT